MNRSSEHALARAALPADQHDRVGGGNLVALFEYQIERAVVARERRLRHLAHKLLLEPRKLVLQRAHSLETLQYGANLRGRKRLGQVIKRAPAHGVHGVFDAGECRHDDDRQPRIPRSQSLEQVESGFFSELQVDKRQVEMRTLELSQGLRNAGRFLHLMFGRFEGDPQSLSDVGFVVDDQDSHVWFATRLMDRALPFILVNRASESKEVTGPVCLEAGPRPGADEARRQTARSAVRCAHPGHPSKRRAIPDSVHQSSPISPRLRRSWSRSQTIVGS